MLPRMVLARSAGLALRRPASVRPIAASVLARAQLPVSIRAYSASNAKVVEEEFFGDAAEFQRAPTRAQKPRAQSLIPEDDFFAGDEQPSHQSRFAEDEDVETPVSSQAPPRDSDPTVTKLVPFASLKGRVLDQTLKSVTFKPFNLQAMSEVQKRVLGRMPELAGGETSASVIAAETPEETAARKAREEAGREDLLVKAKTGTGKTIAFLIPSIDARVHTIDKMVAKPDENGQVPSLALQGNIRREQTRATVGTLIISPTRELATQIANEALKLQTWYKEMQVQLFIGGANRSEQLKKFKSIRWGRKDIIVATPGRLVDLLDEPVVANALATTDMLVLDEADTLLEMGFAKALERIVDSVPKDRQTFLFSATVSPAIEKVAREFLKPNHTLIDCVPKDESNVHLHIPQFATVAEPSQQLAHVGRLIAQDQLTHKNSKIILFLPTTKLTRLYATLIRELSHSHVFPNGLAVHEIHSNLNQDSRSRANERFRNEKRPSILVTSDVSARGVDYPNVTRVIQVGVPQSTDQYVHRVGRTGRGSQATGRGDIILQPFEKQFLHELQGVKVPLSEINVDETKTAIEKLAENKPSVLEKISKIEESAIEIPQRLDPDAITEVFTSLIGFYVGRADMLRKSPHSVYTSLQEWTTGATGLPQPPYLSPSFLQKMGINENTRGGRGGRGGGGSSRGGGGKSFGMRADAARDGGDGFRPRSERGDGFRPRGDRDGGFRPRRDSFKSGGRSDRAGGFRSRSGFDDSATYRPRRNGEFQSGSFDAGRARDRGRARSAPPDDFF